MRYMKDLQEIKGFSIRKLHLSQDVQSSIEALYISWTGMVLISGESQKIVWEIMPLRGLQMEDG